MSHSVDLIQTDLSNEQAWLTIFDQCCKLEDFIVVNGKLYHQGRGGVLSQALPLTETKEEFCWLNDISC